MIWKEAFYYLRFGFESFLLGRRKPIVAGIPLTDLCNLRCRHCVVANAGRGHHNFETVRGWMKLLYERGARILYLQGGEAFGWSDGNRSLDHVIRTAREIGYFKVATVTNGTYPIETEADLVWVSIDGSPAAHDRIRGRGAFDQLAENLASTSHQSIYANMTVNRLNWTEAEAVVRFVTEHPHLQGVSFNFHTPYPGVEELTLAAEQRTELIEDLLRLKKQGYPIVNSAVALKLLMSGDYRRPLGLIQMVEQGQVFECCWGRQYEGVCRQCGYGVIAELAGLSRLQPASLLQALKLFSKRGLPL